MDLKFWRDALLVAASLFVLILFIFAAGKLLVEGLFIVLEWMGA